MTRTAIETEAKFCPYCGKSYYRSKYKSGRYKEVSRFVDQGSCGDPECAEEHRSTVMKRSWERRKGEPEDHIKSPAEVWLSTRYSSMNSVRYKK